MRSETCSGGADPAHRSSLPDPAFGSSRNAVAGCRRRRVLDRSAFGEETDDRSRRSGSTSEDGLQSSKFDTTQVERDFCHSKREVAAKRFSPPSCPSAPDKQNAKSEGTHR